MLTAICFLVTTKGKSYTFAKDDQSGDRESSNSQGQGTILCMVIILLSDHLPHINFTGTRAALVESVLQPDPIRFNLHDSVAEIGN